MSFSNSICAKCLGCNRLELPNFTGVSHCKDAVSIQEEQNQAVMQTRKTKDAIDKIHKILGNNNVLTGEQLQINNLRN